MKLHDRGELRDDILHMLATNVRHTRDFLGDPRARIGAGRSLHLVDEYGLETVTEAVTQILDSAERQARACVQTWSDGVYRGEAILDDDGRGITDIYIRAIITKHGYSLTVDLSDSYPQVIGFVNSSYPNTMSAIHMAFAYLIDLPIPKNERTFRPITVQLKQGTVVGPFPRTPMTLSTGHCTPGDRRGGDQDLSPGLL